MSVEFEAEPRLELLEAARWYEGQRDGLGFEFIAVMHQSRRPNYWRGRAGRK